MTTGPVAAATKSSADSRSRAPLAKPRVNRLEPASRNAVLQESGDNAYSSIPKPRNAPPSQAASMPISMSGASQVWARSMAR